MITATSLRVRAFNLLPGVAIDRDSLAPRVPCEDAAAVVVSVVRDLDREEVRLELRYIGGLGPSHVTLDFCDEVDVIGLCVNEDDPDDDDLGVDAPWSR